MSSSLYKRIDYKGFRIEIHVNNILTKINNSHISAPELYITANGQDISNLLLGTVPESMWGSMVESLFDVILSDSTIDTILDSIDTDGFGEK